MACILKADGTLVPLTDLSLASLQAAVGGYIEAAYTYDGRCMFINEEGKIDNLPFNLQATLLYQNGAHDPIRGDAVLLTAAETKADEEG